jgi:hypothetical protein
MVRCKRRSRRTSKWNKAIQLIKEKLHRYTLRPFLIYIFCSNTICSKLQLVRTQLVRIQRRQSVHFDQVKCVQMHFVRLWFVRLQFVRSYNLSEHNWFEYICTYNENNPCNDATHKWLLHICADALSSNTIFTYKCTSFDYYLFEYNSYKCILFDWILSYRTLSEFSLGNSLMKIWKTDRTHLPKT